MKRIYLSSVALAAIISVASAFSTIQRKFAAKVYVTAGSGGNAFSYTTTMPALPMMCAFHTAGRCEISTNIPVSTLNSAYVNTFPPENTANPAAPTYVRYLTTAVTIYK